MFKKLKALIYHKVIAPIKRSNTPSKELGMSVLIGTLWAFLPLIGIQTPLVLANWFIFRFFKMKFNLAIALAILWLTNPFTMPFIYFTYYLCGFFILDSLGTKIELTSFQQIKAVLVMTSELNLWDGVTLWFKYIYNSLLWPLFIGSLIITIPLSIISYFTSIHIINLYRTKKAQRLNMTLKQWEKKFIVRKK